MDKTTAQKKWRPCSQTWRKDYITAVGDTTKAYFLFSKNVIHIYLDIYGILFQEATCKQSNLKVKMDTKKNKRKHMLPTMDRNSAGHTANLYRPGLRTG